MYKIAHIARPIAGVGVYIDLLVKNIDDQNYESFLISNRPNQLVHISDKSKKEIALFHVDLIREINLVKDIKCFFQIIKTLKEIKPNIIHCHSAKAGFLGRLAGAYLKIPTVYTPHAFSYLSGKNKLSRSLYKLIEKLFKFLPSKIIACSKSEYNRAINDLNYNKNKLHIWNNSIEDISGLTAPVIQHSLPQKYICSIGRPSYQKNIQMMLEMMLFAKKEVKNIHLVLLGVGIQSNILDELIRFIKKNDLSNNITMIPWIERTEAMNILEKCEIYVSSSRYEGLPYSIIEALSLSKPSVVTKVDGNMDLIENGYNGYLVELGDAQKMAKRISSIFNKKELLDKMSINSRKVFLDKYNIKRNIASLEEIYKLEIAESLR